jgi:hypothetical protein
MRVFVGFCLLLGACTSTAGAGGSVVTTDAASDGAGKCDKQLDCTTAQVCASGLCVPLFPHKYSITLQKASFGGFNSSGKGWDCDSAGDKAPPCPPDPVARLLVDGKVVCETTVAQDNYDPTWNKTCEVQLNASSQLQIQVVDRDAAGDDPDLMQKDLTGADLAPDLRNSQGQYQDDKITLWVQYAAK